jgi:hypothetical protein
MKLLLLYIEVKIQCSLHVMRLCEIQRTRCRLKNDIEMCIKEIGCADVDRMH